MKTNIKALIFDIDGTLTLSQPFHARALAKTFQEYGIAYTAELDQKKYSGMRSKVICKSVLEANGNHPTEEEITACAEQKKKYYDEILDNEEIKPVAGITSLLQKASSKKLPIAIASGNKKDAAEKLLTRSGIGNQWFNMIITQEQVQNTKPAPDLFLLAAEQLKTKPEDCVVFEDALNGVMAAKAANMFCIAVSTGETSETLTKTGADIVVKDYNELLEKYPEFLS